MKDKLRIGVISRVNSKTVGEELAGEVRRRGHTYDQIVFETVNLTDSKKTFDAANLLSYDVLYYRTSLGPIWARALQRYLTENDRRAINLIAVEFPFLNNKALQALKAGAAGMRTPITIVDATNSYDTIAHELGSPFVAKATDSAQGKDVHLIRSDADLAALVEARVHDDYLYQQYVAHAYDCRIHLIGGKPVAGYRRMQCVDDFRCNVSLGAEMQPLSKEDEVTLFPLAEQVADIFGLELHVVDFLLGKDDGKYYFVEVNENPGWESSDEEATGVDMSALVVDYFEMLASESAKQHAEGRGLRVSTAPPTN
jgi:glutathione synthase/RimK-type ligase-like ATP-grasp enzyme